MPETFDLYVRPLEVSTEEDRKQYGLDVELKKSKVTEHSISLQGHINVIF